MKIGQHETPKPSYQRHRFPSDIISQAVWLDHHFCLSFREVKELLAERGITVTDETVRRSGIRSLGRPVRKNSKTPRATGDNWHVEEVFVTIQDQRHYLNRAVDQDGDVINILVQPRRNHHAAERFFRRLFKGQGGEPRRLITDKLRSYANNRVEVAHEPTRQRERATRGFRLSDQAEQFLTLHGLAQNLVRLGRHLMQGVRYRLWRARAFQVWQEAVCA